jgi:hypothetical protein
MLVIHLEYHCMSYESYGSICRLRDDGEGRINQGFLRRQRYTLPFGVNSKYLQQQWLRAKFQIKETRTRHLMLAPSLNLFAGCFNAMSA